jgi:putative transposase
MGTCSRGCLALDVERRINDQSVLERLTDLFRRRGVPDHLLSDNGSEFTAEGVRDCLKRLAVKALFIEPGSPWENGYIESFNGKLGDELLDIEIFDALLEPKVLTERWRH